MWLPVDHPATSPVSRLSYLTRKAAGDLRLRSASIHSHCRELFEFPLTPRYSHLPRSSPGLCGVAESVGARMSPRQRECQRSEERRVGKECDGTCKSRWSPDH